MAQNSQGMDPGVAAMGAASINALGGMAMQAARTKKQWKYQQKAMEQTRQMNLEAWNMQNAYNTPSAQMERLQAAGLNPRLIYGGGSSAPNMSGPIQTPEAPAREAVGMEMPNALGAYFSARQADAQYKQTTMATELMQKNAALKDLEAGLKNLDLFKETIRSKNYPSMIEAEQNQARWVSLRSEELLNNEIHKGRLMDQLGTMRDKQITSLELDNAFKQYRNDLTKLGIHTSDAPALRILIAAAHRMNIDLGELLMEGAGKLKEIIGYGK